MWWSLSPVVCFLQWSRSLFSVYCGSKSKLKWEYLLFFCAAHFFGRLIGESLLRSNVRQYKNQLLLYI